MRRVLVALFLLLIWTVGAHAADVCDAPKASIQPSTADGIVGAAAGFAGSWQGQWPIAVHGHVEPICARLYVLVTSSQAATVEQCTGSNSETHRKAECVKFTAQLDDNVMTFTAPQGMVYTFTIADVGGMKGEAVNAQHRSVTVFTKQD